MPGLGIASGTSFVAPRVAGAPRIINELALYDFDFVNNTQKGGVITFDGEDAATDVYKRADYDTTGNYFENADGTVSACPDNSLRRSDLGMWVVQGQYCETLYNRDLTNYNWIEFNMAAQKNQVGVDGTANAATLITALADDATIMQPISAASVPLYGSAFVRRVTGTGDVQMTLDGQTWTTLKLTREYSRVSIPPQNTAHPVMGFRIVTPGNAIVVDAAMACMGMYYPVTAPSVVMFTEGEAGQDEGDRPSAQIDNASSPLPPLLQGAHGLYWEGSIASPAVAAALFVSDRGYEVIVNPDDSVAFGRAGTDVVASPAGQFNRASRFAVNKICAYIDEANNVHFSVNGNPVVTGEGLGSSETLQHMDLCTSAGQWGCGNAVVRRLAYFEGGVLTDADVQAFAA